MTHDTEHATFHVMLAVQAAFDGNGKLLGFIANDTAAGLHSEAESDLWSTEWGEWISPCEGPNVDMHAVARDELGWVMARGQHPSVTEPSKIEEFVRTIAEFRKDGEGDDEDFFVENDDAVDALFGFVSEARELLGGEA